MWLIYYMKNKNKGWYLGFTKEALQRWADENLGEMSGDDEYQIVDLARSDLIEKIRELENKISKIKEIIK